MRLFYLTCLVAAIGFSDASAQTVSVDETPKPVLDAFAKKFPGFKITAVKQETDAGKPAFEIESKNKDGTAVDALLRPDGTFLVIERQIKNEDLPAPVALAVKKQYEAATWNKVEEVTHKNGKVTYEVSVKKADGTTTVATFDKSGKLIEEE